MQERHGACVYEHKDMPDSLEHANHATRAMMVSVLHGHQVKGLIDV